MRIQTTLASLLVLYAFSAEQLHSQTLASRSGDLGLSAAVWMAGDITLQEWGVDITKNDGMALHAFYDAYLIEKLSMGLYGIYSSNTVGSDDVSSDMFEIGFSIKPRFILGDGSIALKPVFRIGYRSISSDDIQMDAIDAMALNGSFEIQFASSGSVIPFIEVGFLAQPVGGNDATGVVFAPIFYFGGGIVL